MPELPIIDVRSDTVTHPTRAMREAMLNAEVGDDVYGDDPTVHRLERLAADLLGKEAALFVPTGNFGNQLALFTHCGRGDEVILGDDCHIVWHETGGAAVIAGVQLRTIESDKGVIRAEEVKKRIRDGSDIHWPKTGLICLENAHSNGRVIPLSAMADVAAVARLHGVPVHLDGARVFNAAVHLGCEVHEITQYADSVMCCLSKGLAAPVGSILAGTHEFIAKARRNRKLLGGGMRQVGVLAAPGILALTEMVERLPEDHARAQRLAERLAALPGLDVDRSDVHINMVWFDLAPEVDTAKLMATLAAAGIRANPPEDGRMRLVTHWQIDDAALERLITAFATALG
ncbi:low-specificity L-threonine aldolase [Crenobacter sp. SG2305]|uniref:low-specificity L-threonine aldolase n=1 Tax=Crenobacter oryzisoli TaxID=3056844 RepID=UPI0025AAEC92|nr:low-specificity L-threonine aldolase [Crenobacter sp. SG2305]MDN0081152.1 low-specificity L-threonine aldolase [Crenobacter sp. SG2305]